MTPALGAMVGRYRLDELVASDALGVVHRARDERSGRPMLVRLMLPLADDPAAIRRFRIELPAIARLDHPSIQQVEEWGEHDGVPYVVTADLGARRLSELLAVGHRLDPRLAMRVLRDLAAALDYAHRMGVVHGAVDPSRVLLGGDGTVRLADFGLTLLAGAAPETDIQALGAIARQLLAGAPPLEALDPRRGWETAGALVDALDAGLGGRPAPPPATAASVPVPAGAAPWWHRLGPLPDRLPLWIALGGGAFAVLLVAAVLAVHALRPGPALALSVGQAKTGDTVVATGSNLPAGQPGTIVLGSRTLGSFRSDERGAFSFSFVVPADQAGSRTVQACWGGGCPLSRALVVIAAAPPLPTAAPIPVPVQTLGPPTPSPANGRFTPAISLNRQAPRRGETIQVNGRGFDPAQQYVILLTQGGHSFTLQTPASPDGSGAFTDPVRIPGDAKRGLAVVSACIAPVNGGGKLGACGQQAILITG
ncbi:MAG TPA: serine/threonine-protein kinase [Candidatus Dormibacteraeota bacterium]|nr:serine/threonine-protein kinase [Candidatus Dormibacteraeota bacterium]